MTAIVKMSSNRLVCNLLGILNCQLQDYDLGDDDFDLDDDDDVSFTNLKFLCEIPFQFNSDFAIHLMFLRR